MIGGFSPRVGNGNGDNRRNQSRKRKGGNVARKRRKRRWSRRRNLTAQPNEVLGDGNADELTLARHIVIGQAADKAVNRVEDEFEANHAAGRIVTAGKGEAMNNGTGANGTASNAPPAGAIEVPIRNRIGRQAQRRLENWIETVWQTVEKDRPTRDALARQAILALGFPISIGNVTGAIKAIGKQLPTPAATMRGVKNAAERKRYRFAVLVAQVESMRQEMGAKPLPEWYGMLSDMRERIDKGNVAPGIALPV